MQEVRQPTTGLKALLGRIRHSHLWLGSGVVLVVVVALAAAGMLYLHPVHQKTIRFATTDASSINVGDSVRVAGIDVGKVSKVSIRPNTVQVEATVSAGTFVGSDSTIDVRMLTPVGGYAVTVIPAGDAPLGDNVIASDHVSVPYSIGDVLQAAPHTTDNVKGGTVDANIEQVAQALQHNSSSVGSLIQGMNSIATVMDRQRDQVRTITDLASEYMQSFNGSREWVFELLRKIEMVLATYDNTHVGFNEAYVLLGDVLYRVTPVLKFLIEHNPQIKPMIENLRSSIGNFQTSMGPAIGQLQHLRDSLAAWLGPNGLATLSGERFGVGHLYPHPRTDVLRDMKKNRKVALVSALVVGVAATGAVGYAATDDDGGRAGGGSGFCADMPDAIGLYPGNPVTQMGYKVGKVDSVHPEGDHVRVSFTLDGGRVYPADVKAVTRSKSLLADRSLELVGNYASGPKLAAGQCVPTSRSSTPKSISQIAGSAADFIDAMSPNNGKQSFQQAVEGLDAAMHGNGELADQMMQHASQAMSSPNQFVADIGSIIHNMAPMSDEGLQKWSTIQSILDRAPSVLAAGNVLWPAVVKVADGFGWAVAVMYMIQQDYGDSLWPLLDGPVADAIHLAAAHSKDIAGLVDSIPAVASVLRQQSHSPGGLAVSYRPPTVRVDQPDAAQMCDALNHMSGGSCINAGGHVEVSALRLLDLVVAKGK